MKEYTVETYLNPNPNNLSIDNLSRTYLFTIILNKIIKIQNILENINLLSKDSINNLTMFINMDIASKEREIIEKIIKRQDYKKELERLKNKEQKVVGLFTQIISFLEKNIKKLQNNDDDYIESLAYESTISRNNSEKILHIGELKLGQMKKILSKLTILIGIICYDDKKNSELARYTMKRINKLEKDVNELQKQEEKILDYEEYYEYHPVTITENNNGELSLSL